MNFSNLVKLAMAEFSLYIEDFKSTSLVRLIIKLFNFEGTKICVYALFIPWKKKRLVLEIVMLAMHLIFYKFLQAEMTLKQLENLSPPIMKQVLPLVQQLPPLYMDLVNGREDFAPKPEETRRLVRKSL